MESRKALSHGHLLFYSGGCRMPPVVTAAASVHCTAFQRLLNSPDLGQQLFIKPLNCKSLTSQSHPSTLAFLCLLCNDVIRLQASDLQALTLSYGTCPKGVPVNHFICDILLDEWLKEKMVFFINQYHIPDKSTTWMRS